MGFSVDSAAIEQVRLDRFDKMIENLEVKEVSKKRVEKGEEERYKSYQYSTPPDASEYSKTSRSTNPSLLPVDPEADIKEDSKKAITTVLNVAYLQDELRTSSKDSKEGKLRVAEETFDKQRVNAFALTESGKHHLDDVESRIDTRKQGARIEESFQIVNTVLKADTDDVQEKKGSLARLARAIAFLAGVIERLDLFFRLRNENSPLNKWWETWGIPEEVKKPIMGLMGDMLLGANASGFAKEGFQGVVREEEINKIVSKVDHFGLGNMSLEKFSQTVNPAVQEILEYYRQELEEAEKALEMIKFILSLLILMLLLILEKLMSFDSESSISADVIDPEVKKILNKYPEIEESNQMIQVAYQTIEKIFHQMQLDEERLKIDKEEKELLDGAMAKALKSMMRQMLSDEEKTGLEFNLMVSNVTQSVNQLFESEEQSIKLNIKTTV